MDGFLVQRFLQFLIFIGQHLVFSFQSADQFMQLEQLAIHSSIENSSAWIGHTHLFFQGLIE